MRKLLLALPLVISGCGVIYTTQSVDKNNELVQVIEVSPSTLNQANASYYKPKKLPAVFKQVSGQAPTIAPDSQPGAIETRPAIPATIQTSVPPRAARSPYLIGVADVLLLATPAPSTQEELTGLVASQNKRQGYTVQDDGSIAVPDVGRIRVAEMTLEQAENAVFAALVDRQIDPKFSLEIAEFNSQRVSLAGSVRTPMLAPISIQPLTLQDALSVAGGVVVADPAYAVVRINRDGQTYQIPLTELRSRPALQKTRLVGGDAIFVDQDYRIDQARAHAAEALNLAQMRNAVRRANAAEARANFQSQLELGAIKRDYVYLAGEVTRQGRFPLPFETKATLADALYSEGGVQNDTGDIGEIYLIRFAPKDAEKPIIALHIDAGDAINLLMATRLELRPDDIVFVSEQKVTTWNRVLSQSLPTLNLADRVSN
ncbi:hypothetical protein GCM10007939_22660 [Amylibacter marinus]|uniref:Polysaccharide export outer membrane protein n=1 Tax=Amylibacter marinus TaxID=1475483 RepID=A0ABQ5VX33_9RHOB|nr:polysaccharide biosynthesis/export family protein [Amylibacter marinus]GLQ35982.1 hypothetical protein GCM10007939_22660 [Amylibacter marinus]